MTPDIQTGKMVYYVGQKRRAHVVAVLGPFDNLSTAKTNLGRARILLGAETSLGPLLTMELHREVGCPVLFPTR